MFWSLLTVCCYTISSLGDQYISSRMKCTPSEFSFFVSVTTAFWLGILHLITGWHLQLTKESLILLLFLILWKLGEFYSSALLLKTVSAYELKAWLGLNILASYFFNVIRGKYSLHPLICIFAFTLLLGIGLILSEESHSTNLLKQLAISLLFVLSKFMYGLQLGMLPEGCSPSSILLVIMLVIAIFELPKISAKRLLHKDGKLIAAATRLPNAAGLLTEALAALENIFLYALIQPMQLTLLFLISMIHKEKMGTRKRIGTILSLLSILSIVLITFH
ncbi:hypothetical protein lbkm_3629 [Lachnospiraceae bacterium KM106-2]|nr:hypothetical protein lbkm_3629 [Lachnospiraceae bacterium KM106-2]